MPNIIGQGRINKGYFFNSDQAVAYQRLRIPYLRIPEQLLLEKGTQNGTLFYRLVDFDTEETIALIKLRPEQVHTHDYMTINKVGALIKGKGYGFILYKAAILDSPLPLLSDSKLTMPGSINVWEKLHTHWKSSRKTISVLNTRTGRIAPYSQKLPRHEIWGYDEDLLGLIEEDIDNLDSALEYEDISTELYDYLRNNLGKLSDRKHIRFIGGRK